MGIASIGEVPLSDEAFWIWSRDHAYHHLGILQALAQQRSAFLDSYVLDPVDREDMGPWLDQHAFMHQQMDTVLNIVSNDLTELDWNNPVQVNAWFALHYVEHQAAAAILGIG